MSIKRHILPRWLASAMFAGVAAWLLCAGVGSVVRLYVDGWATIAFITFFSLLFAAPFALAAYFCFNRRYGDLFMVGAVVTAFLLLFACFTVPRQLGVIEAMRGWAIRGAKDHQLWQPLAMLAVSLTMLLGPFYLVNWFLRVCSHFAAHRIPNGPTASDA